MVKLLRLTTENDGKFNADLDAGIPLGENSSIALQNLTFETIFDVVEVDDSNNDISVQWNANPATPASIITSEMDMKKYDITNINEIFQNVEGALNGTQGVPDPSTGLTNEQDAYGEFRCYKNNDLERTIIDYKLSPLVLPFHSNEDASLRADEDGFSGGNTLWGINKKHGTGGTTNDSLTVTNLKTDNGLILGNIFQSATGGENTAEYKNFTYPSDDCGKLSRGAGAFFCNVASLTDNGQAANTNGFAIGLSFTDLKTIVDETDQISIPATARDFELRIRRPADVYQFCIPSASGTLVDATNNEAPFNYNATQGTSSNAEHDLMMIERIYDDIVGSILNIDTGAGQYVNLVSGNNWTQNPGGNIEIFDTNDLGTVAKYRRTQQGTALTHWWEPQLGSQTGWNIYFTKPSSPAPTPDTTATINTGTGVISITGTAITFNPAQVPTMIGAGAGTAGNKNEIFRYSLDDTEKEKDLYPYIAVFATDGNALVGHPVFTPHVLEDDNLKYEITGRQQVLAGVTPASFNAYDLYQSGYGTYTNTLPIMDDDIFEEGQTATQDFQLTMDREILNTLGYTSISFTGFEDLPPYTFKYPDTDISLLQGGEPYSNQIGFSLEALQEFALQNSDSYIVMLDSNPLMSYDASKFDYAVDAQNVKERPHRGRKVNILATIPVNDNSSGVVEFDASELVYIDLDNSYPQQLKNIRLRLLDKNFNEIRTAGQSVMTLLVKDK